MGFLDFIFRRRSDQRRKTTVASNPGIDPATGQPYPGWISWDDYRRKNPAPEAVDEGLVRQQREDKQRGL